MKSISEQLRTRRLRKPPALIYILLGYIWKLLFVKKLNVKFIYKDDPRKCKKPHIIISNHASRLDYIYAGVPLLPKRYNFVAGYNEFFRSHLAGIFLLLQIIPKRNFTPDIYTIVEIKRLLKKGSSIVLFPEGMSSISGANQPIAIGTGKLLKHLGVPVYSMVIKGGYMTNTKYNLQERPGQVEVTIDRLFCEDDLNQYNDKQIQATIDKVIYHDDFKWNLDCGHKYKGNNQLAGNIGDLLYFCPRCHSEYTITGIGNHIECSKCGPLANIDDTYKLQQLGDSYDMPSTISAWHRRQRQLIHQTIQNVSFSLTMEVELGMLPEKTYLKDQNTSLIVGAGTLTLNHQGLRYKGSKHEQLYEFFVPIKDIPTYGMCTDITRFYTFVDGVFHEFYPRVNRIMRWFLATEELHRFHGGAWQDFEFGKKLLS
jgi:1-acyl-sn-glycerol-3-phosphate acyltransferase